MLTIDLNINELAMHLIYYVSIEDIYELMLDQLID